MQIQPKFAGPISPAKEPQVVQQMEFLNSTVADIESAIETLEKRACGILRAVPPVTGVDEQAQVQEHLCPVADQIRSIRERAQNLSHRLVNIYSRMEV